ncbi:MAG: hypothetical protein AAFW67_13345, partial [Cyanobacteria bacterium J06638_38]
MITQDINESDELNVVYPEAKLANHSKVMYTNADSLSNKFNELLAIINSDKPDMICITETLPKVGNIDLYQNHSIPDYE